MKKISTLAAVIVVGAVAAANAQTSPGASKYSPGHEMKHPSTKSAKTGPGASSYAPGHKKRKSRSTSASQISPGHEMKR
jgi:hypothetical protein